MDYEGLLWPLMYFVLLIRCFSATKNECFRSEKYENARKGKARKLQAFFMTFKFIFTLIR